MSARSAARCSLPRSAPSSGEAEAGRKRPGARTAGRPSASSRRVGPTRAVARARLSCAGACSRGGLRARSSRSRMAAGSRRMPRSA
eukprot:4931047-Alexandrium_andersonii.AAC.1